MQVTNLFSSLVAGRAWHPDVPQADRRCVLDGSRRVQVLAAVHDAALQVLHHHVGHVFGQRFGMPPQLILCGWNHIHMASHWWRVWHLCWWRLSLLLHKDHSDDSGQKCLWQRQCCKVLFMLSEKQSLSPRSYSNRQPTGSQIKYNRYRWGAGQTQTHCYLECLCPWWS